MVTSLIKGYKQFRDSHFIEEQRYNDLVQNGQKPQALVIACCDSRVDPAIITNSKPGELFVVRNIANLVPPFEGDSRHHGTSAALEYGILELGISDIIVFGHSHCGGIRALMENSEADSRSSDFINTWVDIAQSAKAKVLRECPGLSISEQAHCCEKESLLISLSNLKTFPWINERVLTNRLTLHGWYFDLASGNVEAYDAASEEFSPL